VEEFLISGGAGPHLLILSFLGLVFLGVYASGGIRLIKVQRNPRSWGLASSPLEFAVLQIFKAGYAGGGSIYGLCCPWLVALYSANFSGSTLGLKSSADD
jgi:hypothetical protein